MLRPLLLLALALPTGAVAAQQRPVAGARAAPDAIVRLAGVRGPVTLMGWDRDSIALAGDARGVTLAGPPASLRVTGGDATGGIELSVPRTARIEIREGGSVDAIGLAGELVVRVGEGRIRVEGALRRVEVEALEGAVELVGPIQAAVVRTAGGSVVVRGIRGELDVATTSGAIHVGAARVRRARLESVAGTVSFKGVVERAGSLDAQSHGDNVELRLPPDLAASFELGAPAGGIASAFGTVAAGATRARFTTGDGAAAIVARSFKGRIEVLRQPNADLDLNAR
ncbi:MAG: hypothetical protein MUC69_03415 [Gemmatimonadales bacterium]|nr:hypothetical protein [Gemmatimonadales bacterium]